MALPGRQRGHLQIQGPEGTVEFETFTCCHCNKLVRVPHRAAPEDAGGFCMKCMQMTCKKCSGTGRCTPFEKKLEAHESRGRMLASIFNG